MGTMLKYLLTNWKTTGAGVGVLVTLGLKVYNKEPLDYNDIAMLLAALGLGAAKDTNVSGGGKFQ